MVQSINPAQVHENTPPLEFLLTPFRWGKSMLKECLIEKVKEATSAFFGYIIRIITFQMGEMQNSGASAIMRIYSFFFDPPEIKPFDRARLQKSRDLLIQFGGVETVVIPRDRNAHVHMMTFKSEDFFNEFEGQGFQRIEIEFEGRRRKGLLCPPNPAKVNLAKKFYLPIREVHMLDGTLQKVAILPESPPETDIKPHILHSHSPGRSMCMDRRFLGLHLGAGYDVTVWDPRGTVDSTGKPSEGGYYLDSEAVLENLRDQQGIPLNRIYVSGFCEGASIAAHLKRLYHTQGIHFIGSNPYTSMAEVIADHGWLGRIAVEYGINGLQDPDLDVPQDNFNNVHKFENLPRSNGKFIVLVTDTDNMMPRRTLQALADAVHESGPFIELTRCHPDPNKNGHMEPPYQDPSVWRRYVRWVS